MPSCAHTVEVVSLERQGRKQSLVFWHAEPNRGCLRHPLFRSRKLRNTFGSIRQPKCRAGDGVARSATSSGAID